MEPLFLTPSLVRSSCELSGSGYLGSERFRRQAAQARVWTVLVVIDPPRFDPATGISHRQEPRCVQTLLAQPAVESFDEGIVRRFSGT